MSTWLLVCMRCDTPLCSSRDVLASKLDMTNPQSCFAYELEDLMDLGPVWCYNCTDETCTHVNDADRPAAAPSTSTSVQNRYDIIRVATDSVVGVSVDFTPYSPPGDDVPAEGDGATAVTRSVELGGLVASTTARAPQHFLGWKIASTISCGDCAAELGWVMEESASRGGGDDDDDEGDAKRRPAKSFAALQLLRVKQREWTLREMQTQRWSRRHLLRSQGRACELCHGQGEELRGRLQVLTMQCTLYSTLLDRHKEQNLVQTQLLAGQKDRMKTLEDKLETMQQILEAQTQKLDMQMRHIQLQDLLIRDHREQALNQQKQIDVEQKLLADQNSTIRSQLDQLRLLRSHLHQQQLDSLLLDAANSAARASNGSRPLPEIPTEAPTERPDEELQALDDGPTA